jgi:hypothetical protein
MVRNLVILFIFFGSANFFQITFIPKNLFLLLSFASTALMMIAIVITMVYYRGKSFPQKFGLEVGLIFLSVVFAIYGAKWGHNQGFGLSIWVMNYMYFYLLYFFLHAVRVKPEELEKLIIAMGIVYVIFFMIQYVIHPVIIFGSRVQEARGTIRIFIPGAAFAGLVFYLFLQRAFTTGNKLYLIFCFAFLIIPLLQGTRSSTLTTLLGAFIYILFSKRVKSKLLVSLMITAACAVVFILFQDLIMTLVQVSEEQAGQEGEDIRVRAAKFFLTDFYPTNFNYFLGNGESHMMSAYGLQIWYYKVQFGYYQNDIGLIGNFVKFGIIFVLAVFLIFRKFFIIKIEPRFGYLKYWALLLILGEIMGGAFTRPTTIAVIASVMYIYDVSNFELRYSGQIPENETILSGNENSPDKLTG